jgi:DNA-binding transcriptional LysR family regulator
LLGPQHRFAGRRRLRLEELAEDTWTAPTPDGLIWRACVEAGFEPRLAYLTSDPLAIRGLVAAGLAVTMTGRLLAAQLPGLAIVELAGEPARQGIYAVTPSSGTHPLVAPFLEALRAQASILPIGRLLSEARPRPAPGGPSPPPSRPPSRS